MLKHKISSLILLSLLSLPLLLTAAKPSSFAVKSALQPRGIFVGELQEKWQFPSDHLPIGMTFENFHFISWNVLDADFMSWVIEKNSQGLSRSMIAKEHVYLDHSKLTLRDQHIATLILDTLSHPVYPRSIVALQECNEAFLAELRLRIPSHFELLSSHGEALLLDKRLFEIVSVKEVSGIFTSDSRRTVQEVIVRHHGTSLRLINVHLPGDPTKPGRFEFSNYLSQTFDPALTTIAMGDMNFNELEMSEALKQAFKNSSPFALYSPYCTNISPVLFYSKAIDHFLIYCPQGHSPHLSHPHEIMPGLASIVALLEEPTSLFLPQGILNLMEGRFILPRRE